VSIHAARMGIPGRRSDRAAVAMRLPFPGVMEFVTFVAIHLTELRLENHANTTDCPFNLHGGLDGRVDRSVGRCPEPLVANFACAATERTRRGEQRVQCVAQRSDDSGRHDQRRRGQLRDAPQSHRTVSIGGRGKKCVARSGGARFRRQCRRDRFRRVGGRFSKLAADPASTNRGSQTEVGRTDQLQANPSGGSNPRGIGGYVAAADRSIGNGEERIDPSGNGASTSEQTPPGDRA